MNSACLPLINVCTSGNPVTGDVASAIGTAIVSSLTGSLDRLAADVVRHVFSLVGSSMAIQVNGSSWFAGRFQSMASLAAILVVPLLLAGTASALMHQDPRRLARTWLVALPVAGVATFVATDLTQFSLEVADQMTQLVTAPANLDVYSILSSSGAMSGNPGLGTVLSVVLLLGALAVWLELVVRSAAVYVAMFFLPLALAGMVWPTTAHMARRLVEGLASLILMKFVIVTTLSLGGTAVQYGHGVDQVATGAAILLVAAFSPYVLFRMVPIVESAALDHFAGLSRQPFRAAASTTTRVMGLVSTGGSAIAAAGSAGAASSVASTSPGPGPLQTMATYPTGPADWGGGGSSAGGGEESSAAPPAGPSPPPRRTDVDLGSAPGGDEPDS